MSEHTVPDSVSTLRRMSDEVHLLYRKIFERLGLEEILSNNRRPCDLELSSTLKSRSSVASAYFVDVFAQWWCATRAQDVWILANENAHVCEFEPTLSMNLNSKLSQIGVSKPQDTSQKPEQSRSLHYIPRNFNCLAGFFKKHDLWILAMEKANNGLYPAADIETFADAWVPIYKFPYRYQPDLIAKYNVNGGSVIPLPFDPAIRPPLRPNERLCH